MPKEQLDYRMDEKEDYVHVAPEARSFESLMRYGGLDPLAKDTIRVKDTPEYPGWRENERSVSIYLVREEETGRLGLMSVDESEKKTVTGGDWGEDARSMSEAAAASGKLDWLGPGWQQNPESTPWSEIAGLYGKWTERLEEFRNLCEENSLVMMLDGKDELNAVTAARLTEWSSTGPEHGLTERESLTIVRRERSLENAATKMMGHLSGQSAETQPLNYADPREQEQACYRTWLEAERAITDAVSDRLREELEGKSAASPELEQNGWRALRMVDYLQWVNEDRRGGEFGDIRLNYRHKVPETEVERNMRDLAAVESAALWLMDKPEEIETIDRSASFWYRTLDNAAFAEAVQETLERNAPGSGKGTRPAYAAALCAEKLHEMSMEETNGREGYRAAANWMMALSERLEAAGNSDLHVLEQQGLDSRGWRPGGVLNDGAVHDAVREMKEQYGDDYAGMLGRMSRQQFENSYGKNGEFHDRNASISYSDLSWHVGGEDRGHEETKALILLSYSNYACANPEAFQKAVAEGLTSYQEGTSPAENAWVKEAQDSFGEWTVIQDAAERAWEESRAILDLYEKQPITMGHVKRYGEETGRSAAILSQVAKKMYGMSTEAQTA